MRIDAHQHFWDPGKFSYPWMPAGPSPLRRAFLPADLAPILERNRFDGSVFVQATMAEGEAEWALALADANPFLKGVVAWADLTSDRIGGRLDELLRHAKFKGVRHPAHDEEDDGWLLRADVIRGLRELEARDIPFDLLLRPQHLPLVPELAAYRLGIARWLGRRYRRRRPVSAGSLQAVRHDHGGGLDGVEISGSGAVRPARPGGIPAGPADVRQRLAGLPARGYVEGGAGGVHAGDRRAIAGGAG